MGPERTASRLRAGAGCLALAALPLSCKAASGGSSGVAPSAAASASASAAHEARYRSLTSEARLAEARGLCWFGDDCDPAPGTALLAAAGSDDERRALQKTARAALATEWHRRLLARGIEISSVRAGGVDAATLEVEGEACTRPWIEDQLFGRQGRRARELGFLQASCKSPAGSVKLGL